MKDQVREIDSAYTVNDVARRLNVSDDSIRRRIAAGEIKAFRVGNLIRIRPKEVERIESQELERV